MFCLGCVYDRDGLFQTTLLTGNLQDVDSFTTKFANSNEIRTFFKDKIENGKENIPLAFRSGSYQNGRITITYIDDEGKNKFVKTMYSNLNTYVDLSKMKNFISTIFYSKCDLGMRVMNANKNSAYLAKELKRISKRKFSLTNYKNVVNNFLNQYKNNNNYFGLRTIFMQVVEYLNNEDKKDREYEKSKLAEYDEYAKEFSSYEEPIYPKDQAQLEELNKFYDIFSSFGYEGLINLGYSPDVIARYEKIIPYLSDKPKPKVHKKTKNN